ncbi:hypothetical protein CORC01_10769 [Colletotrichum orchidophilum]|uniref:Uncharacterized protein n=1 Tax=Colletotrichum orchidophilum TaxID=1209926 RepID=A0A1G4AXI3_9PEZI|nr:uncharacterized protein CORC01_10769 [Colletotrichum orchidophilum]OHE93870.1 hypothetical protein CORC01_10769 [Colletotrichum orchidophilum]
MTIHAIASSDIINYLLILEHSPAFITDVESSLALSAPSFRRTCPSYRPSRRVGRRLTCHMKETLPINNT